MQPEQLPFFVEPADPPSKREILKTGLTLFVRHGLDGTSIRQIADQAGYTNPALFKFFKTKDELAKHLFVRCYQELFTAFADCVPSNGKDRFRTALGRVLEAYCAAVADQLDALLYVTDNLRRFWPSVSPALRSKSLLGTAHRLIQLGKREGAVSAQLDSLLCVSALVGTLSQWARMRYFDEIRLPFEEWAPALERMILNMYR